MVFSGKPNDNPSHPDHIPSIFPTEYHTKAHMPVSNTKGSVARLSRRMERSAKGEQAKVKAEKTLNDQKRSDVMNQNRLGKDNEKKREKGLLQTGKISVKKEWKKG